MLKDIVAVQPKENYTLHVVFEDGVMDDIHVAELVEFSGIFGPLQDPSFFAQVIVNTELGTVCWPNDADLDPDVIYSLLNSEPSQSLAAQSINT